MQSVLQLELDLAAQFCANREDPWQRSLLDFQVSAEAAVLIEIDHTGFAARVRQFAWEQALATCHSPVDAIPDDQRPTDRAPPFPPDEAPTLRDLRLA